MWCRDRERHTAQCQHRSCQGSVAVQQERHTGCRRARQEALSLAEPSQAALVHHLPPMLQPWYRGSPPATKGVSPTKRGKKKTQSPHCQLSLESFAPSAAAVQEPNALPALLKRLSEGSRLQGAGISSLCRKTCLALLKPAHQRGSGAHQQERREAKVSNNASLLFPPPSLAPALTAPTSQRAVHWPGPLDQACPRGCSRKGVTSSSLLVPPQLHSP